MTRKTYTTKQNMLPKAHEKDVIIKVAWDDCMKPLLEYLKPT
jgi:hypothetical protein